MRKKILFILISGFVFTGCYYDIEEELYGTAGPCDTANVTYSGTISGLLTSYGCIGCHSGTAPSGNISLLGYANVKAKVTDNRLWGSINHSPGFSPMPQGLAKMNPCDLNKIRVWIDAGAPNN